MSKQTRRESTTALGVLVGVCAGCAERDPRVRIEDPVARRLLSWRDGKFAAVRVRALLPLLRLIQERMAPGGYGYIVARTHHMDAIVRGEVAAGLDRIVILRAGYDTRAYRMREALVGVQVVEVDLPATSRDKRARLVKALGSLPPEVTYIEVDFNRQSLLESLGEHGHELSMRTLFLLSGVSMFCRRPQSSSYSIRSPRTPPRARRYCSITSSTTSSPRPSSTTADASGWGSRPEWASSHAAVSRQGR
jgi:methyltransferase (TIGR00027 family)